MQHNNYATIRFILEVLVMDRISMINKKISIITSQFKFIVSTTMSYFFLVVIKFLIVVDNIEGLSLNFGYALALFLY